MIVIIEGVDGVGKTTLATAFAIKHNFEYIKESYTDDVKEKERRVVLMLERMMSGKNYIYDRTTLIDDFVYSDLNKSESTLVKYVEIIKDILAKCCIIHLFVDEETQKQRLKERGDEFVNEEMIKDLARKYDQFYGVLRRKPFGIILTGDLEKDDEQIKEVIIHDSNLTHSLF